MRTVEQRFAEHMTYRFGSLDGAYGNVEPHLWPYFLFPPQGQPFVAPAGHTTEAEAAAFVHQGDWIARCPFCPSAQHVSKDDPRFFCAHCLNAAAGNKTIPVVFPDDHAHIEELLAARPFVTTRNWQPGETTKDLARENAQRGVG